MNTIKSILIVALLFLARFTAFADWCPSFTTTPSLNKYISCFNARPSKEAPWKIQIECDYYGPIMRSFVFGPREEIYDIAAALSGDADKIDSVLEFALASYYSPALVQIRPAQAAKILPANNKQSELKLGGAVFQEIQILRFLGDTKAVGRYEGMLKFITDRKNVTRSDIEKYYRDGIRGFISDIVDEEFGKPGKNGIVPARVYADWEKQGLVRDSNGKAVNGVELIKQVLGDFFLNPTEANYTRVRGIIARIMSGDTESPFYSAFGKAWVNMLTSISPELHNKIWNSWGDTAKEVYAAARQPNDPAFKIFEIPYGVGEK